MCVRRRLWRTLWLALCSCSVVLSFSFLPKILPRQLLGKDETRVPKFGEKKLCVITGTSSGLGMHLAKILSASGHWHVIGAVRDVHKMEQICEDEGFNMQHFSMLRCDLSSFASVREFAAMLQEHSHSQPIDRLVCNAAVYQPARSAPSYTVDNVEEQVQTNFLSHFLLLSLLFDSIRKAHLPRVVMLGSITGNDNTVAGGGVYPIADLRDLAGLRAGGRRPVEMMDGRRFNGAKAYKDSKLALMMLSNYLHQRYHKSSGIAFSSVYPGCMADSPLFREKRAWFRKYFPIFMKHVTGGYVSQHEGAERLVQVLEDPQCAKSGVYWSWNGGPRLGRGLHALSRGMLMTGSGGAGGGPQSLFENDLSDKVLDLEVAQLLFQYSTAITQASWPSLQQRESACPTLAAMRTISRFLEQWDAIKLF